MELSDIITTLIDWAVRIGSSVNDLPGTVAFGLGLLTWFLIEQVLRRILSWMRWVIVIGVIGGLGLSLPYLATILMERGGGAPEVNIPDIGQPSDTDDGFLRLPLD